MKKKLLIIVPIAVVTVIAICILLSFSIKNDKKEDSSKILQSENANKIENTDTENTNNILNSQEINSELINKDTDGKEISKNTTQTNTNNNESNTGSTSNLNNNKSNTEGISNSNNNQSNTGSTSNPNNNYGNTGSISNSNNNQNNTGNNTPVDNTPEFPSFISIVSNTSNLSVGNTLQLEIQTTPTIVKNNSGTWTSSDTSIATVNANGLVTAIKNGTVKITFTSANGIQKTQILHIYYTQLGTKSINQTVYNKNGIVVKALTLKYDDSYANDGSSALTLQVTNNSGQDLGSIIISTERKYSIPSEGIIVNDIPFIAAIGSFGTQSPSLPNNTTKTFEVGILQDYLRSKNIKQISSLKFYIHVLRDDFYHKYSTDLITINL